MHAFRSAAAARPAALRPGGILIPANTASRPLSTTLPLCLHAGEPDPQPTESEEDVRADHEENDMSPHDLEREGAFIANESAKNETKTESELDVDADKTK